MKVTQFFLFLCLGAIILAGCKKDESSPTDPGSGGSKIDITIGSGTKPQYSWSGGNVFSLSIMRTATPTVVVWGLATPGTNGIASPVTNGTAPAGTIETAVTEKTLTAGVKYRISISRLDGTGTTGFKEFTP